MRDVDLDACIRGDKAAWDGFVDRCAPVIYSAVKRTLRGGRSAPDPSELEDTVQDVFVRLLAHECRLLRSYDPGRSALATWLTLVARSVAIDRLRRRRVPTVPLAAHDEPAPAPPDEAAAPRAAAIPLHLLTTRQRLVLRLLFDEGRSVAEAARFIGVNEQTVRSTKHKALTRLREHFEDETQS